MHKAWFQSKTLWLNFIAIATACGGYFTGTATAAETMPVIFTSIGNILLRFVTAVPIRLGGGVP